MCMSLQTPPSRRFWVTQVIQMVIVAVVYQNESLKRIEIKMKVTQILFLNEFI